MNQSITFITGNAGKAEFLAKTLNFPIDHRKLDLDEIQSLDLRKIIEHKVNQAYEMVKKPVLVDDASLSFNCMGKLPGPLIKWFVEEIGQEKICRMITALGDDRSATVQISFGFYDGKKRKIIMPQIDGTIAESPRGDQGFGYDQIFIPKGFARTWAEMDDEERNKTYIRTRAYKELEKYLKAEFFAK